MIAIPPYRGPVLRLSGGRPHIAVSAVSLHARLPVLFHGMLRMASAIMRAMQSVRVFSPAELVYPERLSADDAFRSLGQAVQDPMQLDSAPCAIWPIVVSLDEPEKIRVVPSDVPEYLVAVHPAGIFQYSAPSFVDVHAVKPARRAVSSVL